MDADSDMGFASTQSDDDTEYNHTRVKKRMTRKRLKTKEGFVGIKTNNENILVKLRNRQVRF